MLNLSRILSASAGLACLFAASSHLHAAVFPLFSPSDAAFVIGGQSNGTIFTPATASTTNLIFTNENQYPTSEAPDNAIDGITEKYLNFGEFNTGFIITPGIGPSVASSIQVWTANDAPERDPASFELYGTNVAITGGGPFAMSNFSLISSGPLALPAARNNFLGPLLPNTSQTVPFTNTTAYSSYLILFPTVKTPATANSAQIAEAQLFSGTPVPEPASLGVLAIGALALLARRRAFASNLH